MVTPVENGHLFAEALYQRRPLPPRVINADADRRVADVLQVGRLPYDPAGFFGHLVREHVAESDTVSSYRFG